MVALALNKTLYNSTFNNSSYYQTVSTTTTTANITANVPSMISKELVYAIFVINGILSFVGLLGNIFVCVIIIRGRKMYTIANLFLMNLAIADICVLVVSYPLWVIKTLSGSWPFGAALCKIILSVSDAFYGVSLGCMTTISIHRYRMILHAMCSQLSFFQAKLIIIFIWFLSLSSISVPLYPVMKYFKHDNSYICASNWPSKSYEQAYQVFLTLVWYILPLLIILCTFLRIRFYLCKQMKYEWLQGSNHNILISNHILGIKKALNMLAPVVIIFTIFMLPWNILRMISVFKFLPTIPYYEIYIFLAGTMLVCNSVVNPFIYYIMSVEFRIEFRKQLFLLKDTVGLTNDNDEYIIEVDQRGRRYARRHESFLRSRAFNGNSKMPLLQKDSIASIGYKFSNGNSFPDYDEIFKEQTRDSCWQIGIEKREERLCSIQEEYCLQDKYNDKSLDINDNAIEKKNQASSSNCTVMVNQSENEAISENETINKNVENNFIRETTL